MVADYPHRARPVLEKASTISAALRQEIRDILHLAAEPLRPHDNTKSRLARAAAALQLTRRRAYALWYGEDHTLLREAEIARLRAEKARLLRLREERLRAEIEQTRREIEEALRHADALAADRAVAQSVGALGSPPA